MSAAPLPEGGRTSGRPHDAGPVNLPDCAAGEGRRAPRGDRPAPAAGPLGRRAFSAAAVGAVLAPGAAWAQGAEPLRLLTGFPAGTVDIVARLLAERLQPVIGRPVVVEAHPGASGRLAVQALKAARPDGGTLLLAPHGAVTLFPHVFRQLGYDPAADLVPLAQPAVFDFVLGASNAVPAPDPARLHAWLRRQPAAVGCASPGIGTSPHFLIERYAQLAGVRLVNVPYKSPGEIVAALGGGHVALAVLPLADLQEAARGGRLRMVASFGSARTPLAPELPTLREAGVELAMEGWLGLYGRAGAPADAQARVAAAVLRVLAQPELRARLQVAGLRAGSLDGAGLARLQVHETAFWADAVRRTGFHPND